MLVPHPHYVVPTTLFDVIGHVGALNSLKVCIDAGDLASWPGVNQTLFDRSCTANWSNGLNTTDASGDMTFVGTAGLQSSGEYFTAAAGTNYFLLTGQSWYQAVHKAGGAFSAVVWSYSPGGPGVIGMEDVNLYSGSSALPGFGFGANNAAAGGGILDGVIIQTFDETTFTFVKGTPNVIPSDRWNFVGVAWQDGGTYTIRLNDTTITGACSYTAPTAASNANNLSIRRSAAAGTTRLNSIAAWNRRITDTEITDIYNATKTKFGL
jgi:hypothetical protein